MSTRKKPKVLIFHNQKGGVCKTTLTVNLAIAFSKFYNKKILLLDTDTQVNATDYVLSRTENPNRHTIKDVIEGRISLKDAIEKVCFSDENFELYCVPGTHDPRMFSEVLLQMQQSLGMEIDDVQNKPWVRYDIKTILNLVSEVENENYDFIFIDTPPAERSETGIVESAFYAGDYLVIPTEMTRDAINGVLQDYENICQIRNKGINPKLEILAVVPTRTANTTEKLMGWTRFLKGEIQNEEDFEWYENHRMVRKKEIENYVALSEEIPDLFCKVVLSTSEGGWNSVEDGIPFVLQNQCPRAKTEIENIAKVIKFRLEKKGEW